MGESDIERIAVLETKMDSVEAIVKKHDESLQTLISQNAVLAWKVGLIIAVLVFIANQVAARI